MSERVLKHHVDAAKGALSSGPFSTLEDAARAVATSVIEADGPVRWVVITDHGTTPLAYGPFASAETARKAIDSGLMLGQRCMLLAMKPVPRSGHRNNQKMEK
jgi:hypothetical protein